MSHDNKSATFAELQRLKLQHANAELTRLLLYDRPALSSVEALELRMLEAHKQELEAHMRWLEEIGRCPS